MLIASDLLPLSGRGRYRCAGADDQAAYRQIGEGRDVEPADADTAELIAQKLDAAGNDVRAAMFRRWAAKEFGGSEQVTAVQLDAIQRGLPPAAGAPVDGAGEPPRPDAQEPDATSKAKAKSPEGAADKPAATGKSEPPPDPVVEVKRMIEQAGEDRVALGRIATRAGAQVDARWSLSRIHTAIMSSVSVRVALGKPALND